MPGRVKPDLYDIDAGNGDTVTTRTGWDECMEKARDRDRVQDAKWWEGYAQQEARDGGLKDIPALSAEELAAVAQRGCDKCMEEARSRDRVQDAKWWEGLAQQEARDGGLKDIPALSAEELAAVAQREIQLNLKKTSS